MPVGDVNSTERGSAARYNDGKAPLNQIPLRLWYYRLDNLPGWMHDVLYHLSRWQEEGFNHHLHEAMLHVPLDEWAEASRVFEYGAEKYAQWNWTKGMDYMIPVGCMLRHATAINEGEYTDPESKCEHGGHFVCNLIMLFWYEDGEYNEGRGNFFMEKPV